MAFAFFGFGRWRQEKRFVGLAGLIFLFGFVGLAQFAAWLSQFFVLAAVGEIICWARGNYLYFVWLSQFFV